MTNNEVLRCVQEILDLSQGKMLEIFHHLDEQVTESQISAWLKKVKDPELVKLKDLELSVFLNALICELRGKKEGVQPQAEDEITNNIVVKKLKIALDLKNEDLQKILSSVNVNMNSYELTSYFRKPGHKNYRPIKDTFLQSFFKGLHQRSQSLI